MADLVDRLAMSWQLWDEKPSSDVAVQARERYTAEAATLFGITTFELVAFVQARRFEGLDAHAAIRALFDEFHDRETYDDA